ncbi:GNAT family N-acetyltransferase [Sphingosinicella sp. CPCC 101087]|uniref:GNAT family N-acetyltransferase n=1 Tax=Sphingosinicella sp. CPCC 101087 TaxID=2497754 RepID=UPI00101CEDA4|nr:GNAT family N-acetyltransferase [Sphingosinicella sp. CPCC 101087]
MCPAAQIAQPLDRAGEPPVRSERVPDSPPRRVPSPQEVRVLVRPAAALDGLAADWAELAAAAAEPNCYAESWFIAASLATLEKGRQVRLVEVRRGDQLIGIVPLALEDHYGRSPMRIVQNWWHHHMFLGTPLVRAGEEEVFWANLLGMLDEAAWAPNFLHVRGLVEDGPVHRGLRDAAAARGHASPIVHREIRALLASDLDSRTYYEQTVRAKKRKEIRRLRSRLDELGAVRFSRLTSADALGGWCDSFLALERSGWKGRAGTALACDAATDAFFRRAVAGAWSAGRLDFLRMDLDDRPIAMLVNFLAPPGSFSFKTCFDEEYARFSPGVLIQLENLAVLDRHDTVWMDSCAVENHPMIDSLWSGRRRVVRTTVRLKGFRRTLAYSVARALEAGSQAVRRFGGRGMA